METNDTSSKNGKTMFMLAWICAFGLLILVFSDLLEKQINPNSKPDSIINGEQITVRLQRNKIGHYVTSGTINGQQVVFLVDTGATDVSIPAHIASTLSLTGGQRQRVSTANGTVVVTETFVDTLTIGDIVLRNVDANINPGMRDNEVLLGMSALSQLEFTQRGEWLILRTL